MLCDGRIAPLKLYFSTVPAPNIIDATIYEEELLGT